MNHTPGPWHYDLVHVIRLYSHTHMALSSFGNGLG